MLHNLGYNQQQLSMRIVSEQWAYIVIKLDSE